MIVEKNQQGKIQTIIFSRDRAMQLEGMLRSLFFHCGDIHHAEIIVLYKATNEIHRNQYQILSDEYVGRVLFRQQEHFRHDLLEILDPFNKKKAITILSFFGGIGFAAGSFFERVWRNTIRRLYLFLIMSFLPAASQGLSVLFLVDDNIFVRDFLLADMMSALETQNDLIGFSLRLGENTTYCYSHNQPQPLPEFTSIQSEMVKYDWTKSKFDFGYPLEVSSSLYRLENIFPLILGIPFGNPNTIEEHMTFYADKFSAKYPYLGCYRLSVTFCNPINMVQNIFPNRAGEKINYTANDLATRFSQGERIKTETYRGFTPNACHQEVDLVFYKKLE